MKAVILAGGLGTRLRPMTYRRPKPVISLMGRPFLEFQIRWLESFGVEDIALCLHYQADRVESILGDGKQYGVRLHYIYEDTPMGTGGALANASQFWGQNRLLVLNGDVLVNFDLYTMVDFHVARKSAATIALARVSDPTSYGMVMVKPDGKVARFLEKPAWDQVSVRSINAGVYILEPEVLKFIPPNREISIERETFPVLLDAGLPFYSYREPFYWLDIGTPEKLMQAHFDLLDRRIFTNLNGTRVSDHVWVDDSSLLGEGVNLIPPVFIGPHAKVGDGSIIGPYVVIGEHAIVENECEIRRSVLYENTTVGANSSLSWSLLDEHSQVKEEACIQGFLLSADSVAGKGCRTIKASEAIDS